MRRMRKFSFGEMDAGSYTRKEVMHERPNEEQQIADNGQSFETEEESGNRKSNERR